MERSGIRDLQANAPPLPFRRRNAARQAGSGLWPRPSRSNHRWLRGFDSVSLRWDIPALNFVAHKSGNYGIMRVGKKGETATRAAGGEFCLVKNKEEREKKTTAKEVR